jgi:hypothetical protein
MGVHQQIGRSGAEAGSLPLKNAAHERLAREHVSGASRAEAWRALGRKGNNSSRTFRSPEIQARVEFLRRQFNEQAGISLAALPGCCALPMPTSRRIFSKVKTAA